MGGSVERSVGLDLKQSGILVIGGSGGIGSALVDRLCEARATRIVVTSLRPSAAGAHRPGVMVESVDVAELASVRSLAERLKGLDISVVINCAGVNGNRRLRAGDALEIARREMDVNVFGLMNVAAVFAPLLAGRGGGTFMTVLSFLSHVNLPLMASYCASKAAAHSLTQALRAEWRHHGVKVCGVYPTAVDTTMSSDLQGPKQSPADLAANMVAALAGGDEELFPGDAAAAHAEWMRNPKEMERAMAAAVQG